MDRPGFDAGVSTRLDRESAMPLWEQLRDDLTNRLRRGEFSEAFPGETTLVSDYAVSRHTVREALRGLRQEGLIDSGRGRPTRATVPEINAQGTLYSLFSSVGATGQSQRSVVRVLDVRTDDTVTTRLELDDSTPLVYLERLRLAGDAPLAMDRVWLPASIATPLLDADFTSTSLYQQLADRCGIQLTGGREHVRAIVPSRWERVQLSIPDNVAALSIERVGELRGRPVEWRQTVVRGDRFTLTTEFSPKQQAAHVFGQLHQLSAPQEA